jgi:hypothetical protein
MVTYHVLFTMSYKYSVEQPRGFDGSPRACDLGVARVDLAMTAIPLYFTLLLDSRPWTSIASLEQSFL